MQREWLFSLTGKLFLVKILLQWDKIKKKNILKVVRNELVSAAIDATQRNKWMMFVP